MPYRGAQPGREPSSYAEICSGFIDAKMSNSPQWSTEFARVDWMRPPNGHVMMKEVAVPTERLIGQGKQRHFLPPVIAHGARIGGSGSEPSGAAFIVGPSALASTPALVTSQLPPYKPHPARSNFHLQITTPSPHIPSLNSHPLLLQCPPTPNKHHPPPAPKAPSDTTPPQRSTTSRSGLVKKRRSMARL